MTKELFISRSGQGPALVLLHGWGMNGAIFNPLLEYLNDDFEVLCVDLPGHGKSELVDPGAVAAGNFKGVQSA